MRVEKQLIDDKGFSLIEMILGLAISTMVILAIWGFINVGSQSYESSNNHAKLQSEMQFINGIIQDAVIGGSTKKTKLVVNGNEKKLYTGTKVLCYNGDTKKLTVYKDDGTSVGYDEDDHLVTKYMTSFEVSFENTQANKETEEETTDDIFAEETESTEEATTAPPVPGETYASSNLVRIEYRIKMKKGSDSSNIVYKIRNS